MPPRRPPTAGQLRRERRALIRAREQAIRDFGGLLLEMYKRERFSEALYLEQGAAIVGIEERIRELDTMLATVTRAPRPEANRCACGAPIPPGAHFCANCGRPIGAEPVVSCAHCGAPLPAEAEFCPNCGRPAEPRTAQQASAGQQQTAPATGQPTAASENVER
jgi:membrane protease subunit (stomatin/prohibitin family)